MNTGCAINRGKVDTFPNLLGFAQPRIIGVVNKPSNSPGLSVAIVRSCRGGNLLSRFFKRIQVHLGGSESGRASGRGGGGVLSGGAGGGQPMVFVLELAQSPSIPPPLSLM